MLASLKARGVLPVTFRSSRPSSLRSPGPLGIPAACNPRRAICRVPGRQLTRRFCAFALAMLARARDARVPISRSSMAGADLGTCFTLGPRGSVLG